MGESANVIFDYWRNRIARDLAPFADPGTQLAIDGEGRSISIDWFSRGAERHARFSISSDQEVHVTFLGVTRPYASFLVGPELADLLGLAKMILQAQKAQLFIPTRANLVDAPDGESQPAIDLLRQVLSRPSESATRVVIVTGEAGAGKTRVLQELVRQQASAYQNGQASSLFLYVNAQGRALARLTEALATELQDLRAQLTYHAVATLVRLGVLVPVIDGFDELLGAAGYDDAFSSLSRFIEELDGQGQIVASARSTYYEEEFVSRASGVSSPGGQVWVQTPIRVLAWTDSEFKSYVESRVASDGTKPDSGELEAKLQRVFSGSNAGLRQKPLFVARAVDLVLDGVELTGDRGLLQELVSAYLERERERRNYSIEMRRLLYREIRLHC